MVKQRKSSNAKVRLSKVKFEAEKQMKAIQESAERRAAELQKQVEEAEEAAMKAEEEEKELLENTQKVIDDLCKENGYFCGVILNKDLILQLVNMSIENKGENIRIPYRIYLLDENLETETKVETDTKVETETETEQDTKNVKSKK